MTEPTQQEIAILPEVVAHENGMVPRTENITRQTQRRIYRLICKRKGIEPQFTRPTDKKQRRAVRKQANRVAFDKLSRSERKALRKYTNACRHGQ